LHTFEWPYDGAYPMGNLVMDAKGNLYGTTEIGGGQGNCPESYCGTVFQLDRTDTETLLYRFPGPPNGANPIAGVIRDEKGNLFGATEGGGDSGCDFGGGCGVVFELDTAGKETVLYIFAGSTDGGYPEGGLVRDAAGNLYGTTYAFGNTGCQGGGCGVVFKVDKAGKETVLHTFTGGKDGGQPHAGLIFDGKGNLYGTTSVGGTHNAGTVFKITP